MRAFGVLLWAGGLVRILSASGIWQEVDTPLRRRRMQMGLTQGELAKRCGIWRNTLARYERADQYPERPQLEALIRETGLSADAILFPEQYLTRHPNFLEQFSDPTQPKLGRPRRKDKP